MIGIYVICFIVFPISIFIQAKRCDDKKVLLEKDDTNVIKGFAICLVIFTHLIIELKTEVVISPLLNIFQVTGAVGVLLFFFVSGYGIYKQYNKSFSGKNFWFKRLFNMYLPCIFMQFIFCMIKMLMQGEFSFLRLFIESFFYGWFIDVILIQYFVFYISWMISRSVGGGENVLIILNFLLSIMGASAFYFMGFEARWYNSLWLFPIGMAVAHQEEKLIASIYRKWSISILGYFSAFIIVGIVRTYAYWIGNPAGTDILKVISGTCLSLFICTLFLRISFCSDIMKYMGKRSLFFYIIHLEMIEIINKIDAIDSIETFYIVILLTFIIVEIFYYLHKSNIKIIYRVIGLSQ